MKKNRIALGFEPLWVRYTYGIKQALCAPQSDTSLEEPYSFTEVSDGPYI